MLLHSSRAASPFRVASSFHPARLRRLILALSLLVLSALTRAASANTLTVPGQYATIQAAITASASGDTVLISDGTYTGPGDVDLDFGGRNITVTSVHGAATTVIDCGGSSSPGHRGFYLHSGETNAVISGLTVENGYVNDDGGGIYNTSAGLTVQNCIIKGNTANQDSAGTGGKGGGVFHFTNTGGVIALTNCTVTGNTASGHRSNGNDYSGYGGGVFEVNAGGGAVSLTNCVISDNMAIGLKDSGDPYPVFGGGVYTENYDGGTITLANCTVSSNSGNIGLSDTGLSDNNEGNGTISVIACAVSDRSTPSKTSQVYNSNSNGGGKIMLTNCTVTGIYNDNEGSGSVITVTNCTVTGSTGAYKGGGDSCFNSNINGGPITLTSDIFYGDNGSEVTNDTRSTSNAVATYCDIQGGYPGTGNVDTDPLFVSGTSPYDLHLKPGSPCLGAGTRAGAPATDFDGHTRPNPPSIGAYDSAATQVVSHLLWSNPDGKAAFWSVDAGGSVTAATAFGPFADGGGGLWSATALATGPDGVSHVVWNNPDGKAALWTVQDDGSVTGATGYGPYADGSSLWHASGLSVGPDSAIHLLWANPDGKAAFWDVTPGGSVTGVSGYGPYADGSSLWAAVGVSTGPDNVSHLLWSNPDGKAAFWSLGGDGSIAGVSGYGPYSDGGSLWGAVGVSTGPDGASHLLWTNPDGRAAFWTLGASGGIGAVSGYGPYTDGSSLWAAVGVSTGPDGVSHLLWDNPDGKAALWGLDGSGGIATVTGYGPYTDGAASNLWSAVGVSAGP